MLMVEAQLSDEAASTLTSYMGVMVLKNAVKVLCNHVPYDQQEALKFEFSKNDESAMATFISETNWLQPLGALHGRSMLSFMMLNDELAENLETFVIKDKIRPSLIDKFMLEQPKMFAFKEIHSFSINNTISPYELSTDLAFRNPIHDVLDQYKLIDFRNALEHMIKFACATSNRSITTR